MHSTRVVSLAVVKAARRREHPEGSAMIDREEVEKGGDFFR
jgi:hypothetical protein